MIIDINILEWTDIPIKRVNEIVDENKRKESIKKIKLCYFNVINPLSSLIKKRSFNFSVEDNELTCRLMIKELQKELYDEGFKKEEILKIIKGNK